MCYVDVLALTCEDVYGDQPWLRRESDHFLGRRSIEDIEAVEEAICNTSQVPQVFL